LLRLNECRIEDGRLRIELINEPERS